MGATGWPCDNVRRDWTTLPPYLQQSYIRAINTLVQSGHYMDWLQTHIDINMDVCAKTSKPCVCRSRASQMLGAERARGYVLASYHRAHGMLS